MLGTLVNVLTVVVGSVIGIGLKAKMPPNIHKIVFEVMGLFTLFLGLKMAFVTQAVLILLLSLLLGGVIGEFIDIDEKLKRLGNFTKKYLNTNDSKFTEGLVSAFLLFCIGPLTFLGCIEEGLGEYPTQLLTKATMDGFSSIALASAMGTGVLISAIPLLIFQGSLTLSASFIEPLLSPEMLIELKAVGGLMIVALGLNILEIKQIKVANLLPALLVSLLVCYFYLK